MTVKPRRAEYAALTRTAVLESAAALFSADGFEQTSIDDIATEARVSKGAVYHHFSDKRALFDEVFRLSQQELLTDLGNTLGAALTSDNPPRTTDVISLAVREFLGSYVGDARRRSLLRQSAAVLGVERCRQIDDELALPLITGLLDDLKTRGHLHPVDTRIAATVIFGTACEAATTVVLSDECGASAEEAARIVEHMLSGLMITPDS